MMAEPIELLSMDLPCDQHAPGTVRRALAEAASGCQRIEDGLLVASELVTNAVLHSGCGTNHNIQVRAQVLDDRLQISVHDPGIAKQEAAPRPPAPATQPTEPSRAAGDPNTAVLSAGAESRLGGWGLRIVDQLARRWGAERPDGYLVWAELALSS